MFELLLFDAAERNRLEEGLEFLAGLRRLKRLGAPREQTNREYFRWWAGRDPEETSELGKRWFSQAFEEHGGRVVFEEMRHRLEAHRGRGDRIVLVSGSFAPALLPLATHIQAEDILSTELVVKAGKYTGEIRTPMIGQGKAAAVRAHAASGSVRLDLSHAYGDDISDVPFMELTGYPTAVNSTNSPLALHSQRAGWQQLETRKETP
ncbi:HAD-IB family hydrolase [Arthrobacter sp. S13_S34]|nr:HAD-IB family hydrolase [Arthrobacter sp. S13_S34]